MNEIAKSLDLDSIDYAIIRELQTNSRLSIQDLSAKVGLSASPCSRRLRQLEDVGILTGYTALVNEERLGLRISVFVSVKMERQVGSTLHSFEDAIHNCPEVVDCWLMTGNRDYLLRVVAAGLVEYENFLVSTLTKIPGVAGIESSLSLRRVKAGSVRVG